MWLEWLNIQQRNSYHRPPNSQCPEFLCFALADRVFKDLPGHEGLAIVGLDGQVVTNSGSRTGFRLSQDQLNNLRTRDALIGEPAFTYSPTPSLCTPGKPSR